MHGTVRFVTRFLPQVLFGLNLQIYKACQQRGRIAYKRSGGSRLITHNDHWKSQIRHALYTCDRFSRCAIPQPLSP